jgi:hypothetical protein
VGFLYGDSTPAPLELDYLDYLRRMLGLAVEVLLVEDQLADIARKRGALAGRTTELAGRLEGLRLTMRQAVGELARSPVDDPVTRCANNIEGAVDEVVARSVGELRAQADKAAAELAARAKAAHATCAGALDAFVRTYDLPGAEHELHVAYEDGAHAAWLLCVTTYGVSVEIELAPKDTPFAAPEVRVAGLVRELDVQVIDAGGKRRKVRLDRLLVTRVRADERTMVVELRASGDAGAEGFDLIIDRGGAARLASAGASAGAAVDASADNGLAIARLAGAVGAAVEQLRGQRAGLRAATIDDQPLDEHERPGVLIDRVFAAMAPLVRTIAERSLNPGELVIRKQLGDGRREEIFVKHAALAEVVAQVPAARRRHFAVLGIPGLAPAADDSVDVAMEDSAAPEMALAVSDPSISIEPASD